MSSIKDFDRAYILLGLSGALLAVFLDSMAAFSLLSYIPLYSIAIGYGAVGVWTASKKQLGKLAKLATLITALLILVLCFALPSLQTSPRKAFHVNAASIEPGMSMVVIENKMRDYGIQKGQGYTAFVFRVDANTEDRVIIDLAEDHTARTIEIVTN